MKQSGVIRVLLVGLPVGVLLLGVGSVLLTQFFGGPDAEAEKEAEKRLQAAGIMQKPVSREDLESYVRVLSEEIGERHLEAYPKLRAAAFWIESTIGPSNMGYEVERQTFDAEGKEVWNVIATLPGRKETGEIVVVSAHYDSEPGRLGANRNGSGVAAMMALANAFSGSENARTLQFVAFVNGGSGLEESPWNGSRVFAGQNRTRGEKVRVMISLDSIGKATGESSGEGALSGLGGKGNAAATGADLPAGTVSIQGGQAALPAPYRDFEFPVLQFTSQGPSDGSKLSSAEIALEKMDFDQMTRAVLALEGLIRDLANQK